MEQIIYGDTLFIINFSMDFLSLFLTGKILYARMRTVPLVLASSLGGIYAVASLFFTGNSIIAFFIHLAVPIVMCMPVFGLSPGVLLRASLLFYAISLFFGGGMTVLFTAINRHVPLPFMASGSQTAVSPIPLWLFIPAAALCALLSYLVGQLYARRRTRQIAQVTLESGERKIKLHCLCDSGNLLCEPMSGKPVIVTTHEMLLSLLPISMRTLFRSRDPSLLTVIDPQFSRRVRLIPASGVGYTGLLWGFLPDKVTVNGIEKDAYIAIGDSECTDFSGQDGILPSVLLT